MKRLNGRWTAATTRSGTPNSKCLKMNCSQEPRCSDQHSVDTTYCVALRVPSVVARSSRTYVGTLNNTKETEFAVYFTPYKLLSTIEVVIARVAVSCPVDNGIRRCNRQRNNLAGTRRLQRAKDENSQNQGHIEREK